MLCPLPLLLHRLLESRHDSVPKWAEKKLVTADRKTLERWSIQFLDVKSLDDGFK